MYVAKRQHLPVLRCRKSPLVHINQEDAPCRIESGNRRALPVQLRAWLEVVPQALLLSAGLYYWVNHPEKKWLNWVFGIAFALIYGLLTLGLLVSR